jgi:hypothetical protein
MPQTLEPRVVSMDVVGGPECAEQLASCRQLPYEVGQLAVVRVAACFCMQRGDAVSCDAVPVEVKGGRARVEEDEASGVHGLHRAVVML